MKQWVGALGISGIGFYIAGVILLGVLGGRWLDSKLSSEPAWLIVGIVLGVAAAFLGTYNMIRSFINNERNGENN